MASDAINPQVGDRVFDGSEFVYLKDTSPGDLQGTRTAQQGFGEVLMEIESNKQQWAAKAGMTPEDMANLTLLTDRIARIDVFIAPVRKFLEMLVETRYLLEDQRQRIVLNLGASVERRGKEIPELLAAFQKTREYRSAAGKKAAKTRKKAQEQAQREAPPHS